MKDLFGKAARTETKEIVKYLLVLFFRLNLNRKMVFMIILKIHISVIRRIKYEFD